MPNVRAVDESTSPFQPAAHSLEYRTKAVYVPKAANPLSAALWTAAGAFLVLMAAGLGLLLILGTVVFCVLVVVRH